MPASDLLQLKQDPIVELYTIDLAPIGFNVQFRFCNQSRTQTVEALRPVSFNGQTYDPTAIEIKGFELNAKQMPTPQVRISNVGSAVSMLLRQYRGLIKARVTRVLTYAKHLDDGTEPNGAMELDRTVWFIDRKVSEDKTQVTFELASSLDLMGIKIPHRLVLANLCWWAATGKYRGAECGYTGTNYFDRDGNPVATLAQDDCGGGLDDCRARFGANQPLSYGGYPGAGNQNYGG